MTLEVVADSSLLERVIELDVHHLESSETYARIRESVPGNRGKIGSFQDLFPLPVDAFKSMDLMSVPKEEVYAVLESSGTTGHKSKIFLDKKTARLQSKSTAETLSTLLSGRNNLLFVIDSREELFGMARNTARAAATLAFMQFAPQTVFLEEHHSHENATSQKTVTCFGFTSQIYEHLISKQFDDDGYFLGATLIHGGGWKKLESSSITKSHFRELLKERYGFSRVIDYYGMVEQLGNVWLEIGDGLFLPPKHAGAILRDPKTLQPLTELGQRGLIQLFSDIPHSYPGHSLLTGDYGEIHEITSESSSVVHFGLKVLGRLPSMSSRGCSDAIEQSRESSTS